VPESDFLFFRVVSAFLDFFRVPKQKGRLDFFEPKRLIFPLTHWRLKMQSNFFKDTKYCPRCHDYVRYLQSLESSFCVDCGGKVRLFSTADKRAFLRSLKQDKNARRTGSKRVS
jgi:hypothetical protein